MGIGVPKKLSFKSTYSASSCVTNFDWVGICTFNIWDLGRNSECCKSSPSSLFTKGHTWLFTKCLLKDHAIVVFQYLMITPVFFTKHKYETPMLRYSKPPGIFHVWKLKSSTSTYYCTTGCWWLVHWRAEQSRTSVVTVNFPSLQKGGPSSSQKAYLHQASWHKTWNRVHTKRFHIKEGKEPKTWTRMVGTKMYQRGWQARQTWGQGRDSPGWHESPLKKAPRRPVHARVIQNAPKITPNIRACGPEIETNVLDSVSMITSRIPWNIEVIALHPETVWKKQR